MATPADPAANTPSPPADPSSSTTEGRSPSLRRSRRLSPAFIAPDRLPEAEQGSSARFLVSVLIVLGATVAAAYVANHLIVRWAVAHHLRTAQLNLSAAMGGLFAGGLAALVAILIVTSVGNRRKRLT